MKQMEVESKVGGTKRTQMSPPPPPPRYWVTIKAAANTDTHSVTKQEIARFWRQKRMEEEDHLLAAIKAASRIRARNLTEEDYRRFEGSLKESSSTSTEDDNYKKYESNKELAVGIKDWWTKSKYAYLNQPAIGSIDATKRTSKYIPSFCFYRAPSLQATSLGVF